MSLSFVGLLQTLFDYKSALDALLNDDRCPTQRKIFIILDGIDQLDDFESSAQLLSSWLPRRLPINMKVLLTLRDGRHLQQLRAQLESVVSDGIDSFFHQVKF